MRRCGINLPNRCYHPISRVARRAVQSMIAPLNDIYRQVGVSFYLDTVTVTNIPDAYNLPYDRNGGCHGRGVCGTRYYPPATTLDAVLHRLLMYGAGGGEDDGRDLTIGAVRGVWYKSIGGEKIWYLGPAPVGFFENEDRLAVPIHQ